MAYQILPKRGFADTPRGQIHYMEYVGGGNTKTKGGRPALLMLHQTPRSSDEFLEVLPLFGENFRAIAIDTIGFGNSYKSADNNQPTIEDFASGVIDFLDALGITKTHLLGHHTGAVIAIEVAVSHPERVHKLVLSACPYVDEDYHRHKEVMDSDEETEDGSYLLSLWQRRRAIYPKDHRVDHLRRFMIDALLAGPNRTGGHAAVRTYKLEDKYGRITQPTLLVVGTEDHNAGLVMKKVAKQIKGSRMRSIVGGTVTLPNQMPKEFVDTITPFLLNG
jgi:pimeloyl-ACP methyl ester carboxylesterase